MIRALVFATIAILVATGGLSALAGQDSLWAKLIELTERKANGKELPFGTVCAALGLSSECRVAQVPYLEQDGYSRGTNVLREVDGKTVYIILFKWDQSRSGHFYLADADGRLRSVAQFKERVWKKLPVEAPEVQTGFVEEVAYWQRKLPALEKEPDRRSTRP